MLHRTAEYGYDQAVRFRTRRRGRRQLRPRASQTFEDLEVGGTAPAAAKCRPPSAAHGQSPATVRWTQSQVWSCCSPMHRVMTGRPDIRSEHSETPAEKIDKIAAETKLRTTIIFMPVCLHHFVA